MHPMAAVSYPGLANLQQQQKINHIHSMSFNHKLNGYDFECIQTKVKRVPGKYIHLKFTYCMYVSCSLFRRSFSFLTILKEI